MTKRIKATTATPEQVAAMEALMRAYANSLGPNETIETVYKDGGVRVWKQEGRFHAAIDVPIDDIS